MTQMHPINRKYEIFPTKPQRGQIDEVIREGAQQWNHSVRKFQTLRKTLNLGDIAHIMKTFFAVKAGKQNTQHLRNAKIEYYRKAFPELAFDDAALLYDLNREFGKILPSIEPRHLRVEVISRELTDLHQAQVRSYDVDMLEIERKHADDKRKADLKNVGLLKKGKETKRFKPKKYRPITKKTVYWRLSDITKEIAGEVGNRFMVKSFQSKKGVSKSGLRADISGGAKSRRWNAATRPSPEQRKYGAKGLPAFKRTRDDSSFMYPEKRDLPELIRPRKKGGDHLLYVAALPEGMREVKIKLHRPLPDSAEITHIGVRREGRHYFAIFGIKISTEHWELPSPPPGILAGVDPGAGTPLTVSVRDLTSCETYGQSFKYNYAERGEERLAKLQRVLAQKEGRKRTKNELQRDLNAFKEAPAYKKLSPEQRKQALGKRSRYLNRENVRSRPSKAYLALSSEIRELRLHIRNQRKDVHEKISHSLATNFEVTAFGHWEPEREVVFRKKKRELQKAVRINEPGAKKELKKLEYSASKNDRKGVKKIRRGGRDRGIATLRSKIEDKAVRSGAKFVVQGEYKTTIRCSVCRQETGPRGDLSIREWTCSNCNTFHGRDLNSGFEILNRCIDDLSAVRAESLANTEEATDTRDSSQEAMSPILKKFLDEVPATGSKGEVSPLFPIEWNKEGIHRPKLWDKFDSSLKSLKYMEVTYTPAGVYVPYNRLSPFFFSSYGPFKNRRFPNDAGGFGPISP